LPVKPILPKILIVLMLLFSNCAYYNTFYNAKKAFKEAEKERARRRTDDPTSTEIQKYDKAIEKASKVMELHPKSRYVDDAIMLVGQAFYYKRDYHKAKRKFEELLTYFPKGGYAAQARLWLGKAHLALNDDAAAEAIFRELASSRKDRSVAEEGQLLVGEVLFKRERFAEALQEYSRAVRVAKSAERRTRAQLRVGECYLRLEDYPNALGAFGRAARMAPAEKLKREALFQVGVTQKLAGEPREAIRIFTRLLGTAKTDEIPKLRLEIADGILSSGSTQEAIDEYTAIMKDFPRSDASAKAAFRMGEIYERYIGNFEKAKEFYDKVRTEYARSEVVPQATERSDNLTEVFKLKKAIADFEARLFGTPADSAAEGKGTKKEEKPKPAPAPAAPAKSSPALAALENPKLSDPERLAQARLLLGELYLLEFSQPDSAVTQYAEVVNRFPETPAAPRALFSLAYILGTKKGDRAQADSLYRQLMEKYPSSPQAVEARKRLKGSEADGVGALFQEAENAAFEGRDFQKALQLYERIAQEYPHTEFKAKALYAKGWIYERQLHSNENALREYRRLLEEFPESPYSKQVKEKVTAVEQKAGEAKLAAEGTGGEKGASTSATPVKAGKREEGVGDEVGLARGEFTAYDIAPKPLATVLPNYPEMALEEGLEEDEVHLEALVDEQGKVDTVIAFSGAPLFQDSALAAVKRWQFTPALRMGRPLPTWVTFRFQFSNPLKAREKETTPPQTELPTTLPPLSGNGVRLLVDDALAYDFPPVPVRSVDPTYPPLALKKGIQGTVEVKAQIDSEGKIREAFVIRGSEALREAALTAIRQWTFKPALSKGRPIAVWSTVPFVFESERLAFGGEEPPMDMFIPLDVQPTPIKVVEPKYPEPARKAGVEGTVSVKALVDEEGKVKRVVVVSGPEVFHDAAIEAAEHWLFKPATKGDRPVAVWVAIPFVFKLK